MKVFPPRMLLGKKSQHNFTIASRLKWFLRFMILWIFRCVTRHDHADSKVRLVSPANKISRMALKGFNNRLPKIRLWISPGGHQKWWILFRGEKSCVEIMGRLKYLDHVKDIPRISESVWVPQQGDNISVHSHSSRVFIYCGCCVCCAPSSAKNNSMSAWAGTTLKSKRAWSCVTVRKNRRFSVHSDFSQFLRM